MKALIRIAPRRHELRARRRAILRWGLPITMIGALTGATLVATRLSSSSAPRAHPAHHDARRLQLHPSHFDRTFTLVSRAMYDDFPSWLAQHPRAWCPGSVRELMRASLPTSAWLRVSNLDGWHHPMELRCRQGPAGHTIQLRSAGADGRFDTADDVYVTR